MSYKEPSDLELALWERSGVVGWPFVGPLTHDLAELEAQYIAYCEERDAEHEAQERAGGRMICPNCGERSVKVRTVCTLGYAGHPGADYSALEECERCDYQDLG